jgi:Uncharacterized conserved protein (DUF2340)
MEASKDDFDDKPTNLAKPLTSATITVRVVKSFEYRVAKALVLHNVDLERTTAGQLKQKIHESTYDINTVAHESTIPFGQPLALKPAGSHIGPQRSVSAPLFEGHFILIGESPRYAQALYKSSRKQGGLRVIPRSAL